MRGLVGAHRLGERRPLAHERAEPPGHVGEAPAGEAAASVPHVDEPPRVVELAEEERAEVLAALRCVDGVCVFHEDTPHALLEAVRPHIHAKGGDYRTPDALPETPLVRSLGGEVVILSLVPGRSTTRLIERIEGNR